MLRSEALDPERFGHEWGLPQSENSCEPRGGRKSHGSSAAKQPVCLLGPGADAQEDPRADTEGGRPHCTDGKYPERAPTWDSGSRPTTKHGVR